MQCVISKLSTLTIKLKIDQKARLAILGQLLVIVLFAGCQNENQQQNTAETPSETEQIASISADTISQFKSNSLSQDTAKAIATLVPDTSVADARVRYLAGLKSGADSSFNSLRESAYWQQHAAKTNASWARFTRQRQQVGQWAAAELQETQAVKSVFYPFSGPDFAHVFTLFPHADSYTMIGLEPVGNIPALESYSPEQQKAAFKRLSKALHSILSASFFITKEMDTVLRGQELRGTAPIIQFFMVRLGCKVNRFELLKLDDNGQLVQRPAAGNDAIRISFTATDGSQKTLVYISGNLNNFGLSSQNKGLGIMISQLPECITYLKSASYLLHSQNFQKIRSLILDKSAYILQDDSGLPFKFLQRPTWQTKLYGNYNGTIRLFAHRNQSDMQQAYTDSASAGQKHPLGFRLGYGKMNQINLQFAKRVVR